MKPKFAMMTITVLFLAVVFILYSIPAAAEEITVVGEVNDNNEIVVSGAGGGKIYEVDDTPQGNDLVVNYISQKVKVTGSVRMVDGMPVLAVREFEVVPE
jgi:hypothetical protein